MGDRDKQEEVCALALGRLAMEAARLEQETKNLVWMVCGAPYVLGLQMTKGKQLGAICDDGKALAELLPPEVAESMVSILANANSFTGSVRFGPWAPFSGGLRAKG